MSTPYAGNPASYPANVSLPDDGEPAAARTFAPAYQQLADRTAWLAAGLTAEAAARAAADTAETAARIALQDKFEVLVPRQRADQTSIPALYVGIGYLDPAVDVTLFTSAVPTQVGDVVTVTLAGTARLSKAASSAGRMDMTIEFYADQNGGGDVAIPHGNTLFAHTFPSVSPAPELYIPAFVRGSFVVATAGSLVIKARFQFLTGTNALDFIDFQNGTADLLIERA